uniref:Uncharacterized protein n=1 Tax=Anguilla anguilla TaxID=7936 RepID=A0A0E9R185_ANGAN
MTSTLPFNFLTVQHYEMTMLYFNFFVYYLKVYTRCNVESSHL